MQMQEMWVQSLSQEHSHILAWEILWTEEPGRLQFIGLQRVGYHLTTKQQQSIYTHTHTHTQGNTKNISISCN